MSSSPDQASETASTQEGKGGEVVNNPKGINMKIKFKSSLPFFELETEQIPLQLPDSIWKRYGLGLIAVGGFVLILLGIIVFISIPVPRPLTTKKVIVSKNESIPELFVEENGGRTKKCNGDYCQINILRLCKADPPLILKIKDNNSVPSTGTFLFALALNNDGKFKTTELKESEDVNLRDYYQAKPGTFKFMMDKLSSLDNTDKILFFINSSSEFNGKYEFNFDCNDQNLTNLGLMKGQILQFFKQLFSAN